MTATKEKEYQKEIISYAKLACSICEKEGEEKFQEKIIQNGHHPELKSKFLKFFPDTDMK